MRKFKLLVVGLLLLSTSVMAQTEINLNTGKIIGRSEGTTTISPFSGIELVYNIQNPSLLIYKADPAKTTGRAVIVVPGTSLFYSIALENEGVSVAKALNKQGITVFILKYTLVDIQSSIPEKEMIAALMKPSAETIALLNKVLDKSTADMLSAVTYVRSHASEYGIDPQQIGIAGFSTGGSIALNAAYNYTAESRPNFIATMYPIGSLVKKKEVPSDAPNLFIASASDDKFGAAAPSSLSIYKDWSRAGKKADLHIFSKGGNFGMKNQDTTSDKWFDLFLDWMKKLN